MSDAEERGKEAAARHAVSRVNAGQRVALGTGSTAACAVRALAERFPSGRVVEFVASSRATEELAHSLGLSVGPLRERDRFDLMLDGADEVTPSLDLTKGGGGALLREKLLARLSRELVILVDPSKLVEHLGERASIPVEIVPFARPVLLHSLAELGYGVTLRLAPGRTPFRTENGNEILDLRPARPIEDPRATSTALRSETGVVETGIFAGLADRVVVGYPDGRVEERLRPPGAPRRR